jgi:hypothetical protein
MTLAPSNVLGGVSWVLAQETPQPRPATRDWNKFPAIVEVDIETSCDIFALGDVHGAYDRLVTLLTAGKVIAGTPASPEKVEWAAGNAVLVCTGDLIDKGAHSVKVLTLFKALATAAAKGGGRVIITLGNHEAEFLADPVHDKKAAEFIKELKDLGIEPKDVAAGRDSLGIGEFLHSLPFAARVNDWFFAHAGNTKGLRLKELQSELQQGVDANGYKAPVLLRDDSILEARLHPMPWWEEKNDQPEQSQKRLSRYVKALGVKHLVIGHQPGKVKFSDGTERKAGKIYQKFDGLIFLIDVGMSNAPDLNLSQGTLLRIRSDPTARATAIYPDRTKKQLWPTTETDDP